MGDAVLTISDTLALPLEAVTETFAILAKRGAGKALAVDTPIPTPDGWKPMGELVAGDTVFDDRGEPCRVTVAHPFRHDRPCYRLTFADGAEIVADGEHLWLTEDLLTRLADQNAKHYRARGRGGRAQCERSRFPSLRTTEQIAATIRYGKRGDLNHAVRNAAPLVLPQVDDLPIPPYTLGAWLGDGTGVTAVITTADPELLDEIRADGYDVGADQSSGGRTPMHRIHRRPDGKALNTALREHGLLGNKHVPESYLRASAAQRLALLQGLMDTDGGAEGGRACFSNTNPRLAEAVHELVVSLGWRAWTSKRPAKLYGVEHGVAYQVAFRPDVQPFRLRRKYLPLGDVQAIRHQRRMIRAVDRIAPVPVRCIAVDSPSHLFLAGRDMVPTHNTYTASVMVEEFIGAGQPVVVIDPTGAWWGLRSSADGEGPGLPVVIFGGDHADLPLPDDAGELIADLIMDERVPAVLDLSHLSKTKSRNFVRAFMERLYFRNREPLQLVVDEADLFAPQRGGADTARLIGAYDDIVRRGRIRGLGCISITQRPASLHKDILTQSELLVVGRMNGVRDVAAVNEWVSLHAEEGEARQVKDSLASLPIGTVWVWSPGWLGILQKVKIRARRTFDSSATPKPGQRVIQPRRFADVDLDRLRERLAVPDADEPAPAAEGSADTSALRRQVDQLTAELTRARAEVHTVEVQVPALGDDDYARLDAALAALTDAVQPIATALAQARNRPAAAAPAPRPAPGIRPVPTAVNGSVPADGDTKLALAETKILTVLAQHGPRTSQQIALLTGYSGKSGGFRNSLSSLRTAGRIGGHRGGLVEATPDGLAALGQWQPLPVGAALVDWWKGQLGQAERRILDVLVNAWPNPVPTANVAELAGYTATSGGFRNACSRLRTLGLADGQRGELRAADELGDTR